MKIFEDITKYLRIFKNIKIFNIQYLIFFALLFVPFIIIQGMLCSLFFVISPAVADSGQLIAYDPAVREELKGSPLAEKEVPELIGTTIKAILSIVGSIALVIVLYGGFQWMTAHGNAEQVASAQKIMLWAALGVLMIFGSYLVLDLVFKAMK